ncbi:MAG: epoxyqueuosine reductase QueH [Acutalibacteraceae bacterium]
MERNYQRELDKITQENALSGKRPRLLLHACCAPCSSYCLEYLSEYFDITVLFYNPNLYPEEEYDKRAREEERLIKEMNLRSGGEREIKLVTAEFDSREFYDRIKGLENCREGGERCLKCFELRLEKAAEYAKENSFDFFTTTLTISPLKNAAALNEAGEKAGEKFGVRHLPSDFKKKGGYQRSIVLSKEFGLYRQNYCGCVFSLRESAERNARREMKTESVPQKN